MIRSVLLYCYPTLSIGESAKKKLQPIQDRGRQIIALTENTLDQVWKKRVSIDVFKLLNVSCRFPLQKMFKRLNYGKDTRGNGSRLMLPKVKSEAGRKSFDFQNALSFYGLPIDIINESHFLNFERKIYSRSFFC